MLRCNAFNHRYAKARQLFCTEHAALVGVQGGAVAAECKVSLSPTPAVDALSNATAREAQRRHAASRRQQARRVMTHWQIKDTELGYWVAGLARSE